MAKATLLLFFLGLFGCSLVGEMRHPAQQTSFEPQQVIAFNPENCFFPCILGIQAGETSYSEALRLIRSTVPDNQVTRIYHTAIEFWIENEGTQINEGCA